MQRLMEYAWPGNVRELKHAVEHALVTVGGDRLTLLDFPPELRQPQPPCPDPSGHTFTPEQKAERDRILRAMKKAKGNRTEAAKHLGFSRVTLWKKLRRLGLAED